MTPTAFFRRPDYGHAATGSLGRKGALALVTRVAPGGATLLTNILIGRLGGSVLLGSTQTVMSAASLGALGYPAGPAASRYLASLNAQERPELARAAARFLVHRVALVSLGLAAVGSGVAMLIGMDSPAVAVMIGVMLVAIAGRTFTEGLHFGGGEGARLAKWSVVVAAGSTCVAAILLLVGVRDVWVLAPLAGLNLLFFALSWPRRSGGRLPESLRREIRVFIVLSMLGSLTSTGFAQAAILVAGATQSLGFVGHYAAAMTLTTPIALAASALSAVLFPALAAAHGAAAKDVVAKRLRSTTSLMVSAMIAIYIPAVLVSDLAIGLVWGPGFEESEWIILFLLPAAVAGTLAVPAVSAVTAASNRGMALSATSSAIGALCGVAVWVIGTALGAEYTVPMGYAVGTVVIAAVPWVIAWRQNQLDWWPETMVALVGLILPLLIVVANRTFFGGGLWLSLGGAILLSGFWLVVRRRHISQLIRRR